MHLYFPRISPVGLQQGMEFLGEPRQIFQRAKRNEGHALASHTHTHTMKKCFQLASIQLLPLL